MSADVTVDPVTVSIDGLNDISATVGLTVGNLKADLGLDAISASVKADLGLGDIKAQVKADVGLGDIHAQVKADLGLDDIKADLTARLKELAPFFFNLLWKEIPLVKIGCPHRYKLDFCVFGHEVFSIRVCGESELISEKNACPPAAGAGHVRASP